MQVAYLPELFFSVAVSIVVAALGYVIGRLLKYIVTFILDRIGFDDWIKKISVGKAIIRAGFVPARFFGNLVAWIVYISFILLAVGVGSREVSRDLGGVLYLDDLSNIAFSLLTVYVSGFIKAFLAAVAGFILVDGFVGYIYKTSELRSEVYLLVPVAEYLRILLYINVIIFSLSLSGVGVDELLTILQPVIWGITAIMIAVVVEQIILRLSKK